MSSDSFAQFGGTCTGVAGKWSGRMLQQGMDSHGLGWWSHMSINGKSGGRVLIVTACQACKASIATVGPKTAYAQQWHLLRQAGNQNQIQERASSLTFTFSLHHVMLLVLKFCSWGTSTKHQATLHKVLTRSSTNTICLTFSCVTMDSTKKWMHFHAAQRDWIVP
jgi:hypothetical protein